jgi:hypothetical protein
MPPILPGESWAPPATGEGYPDRLAVGETAPDFQLAAMSGDGQVSLASLEAGRPVVLIFGSYSCPVFRGQIAQLNRDYEQYKNRADFYLIYIREAHPGSKLYREKDGQRVLEVIDQTDTLAARQQLARDTVETFQLTLPTWVDGVGNQANREYAGWPVRFVAIGADGKLAYKGRLGPYGFWPSELEAWLQTSL